MLPIPRYLNPQGRVRRHRIQKGCHLLASTCFTISRVELCVWEWPDRATSGPGRFSQKRKVPMTAGGIRKHSTPGELVLRTASGGEVICGVGTYGPFWYSWEMDPQDPSPYPLPCKWGGLKPLSGSVPTSYFSIYAITEHLPCCLILGSNWCIAILSSIWEKQTKKKEKSLTGSIISVSLPISFLSPIPC